MVDHTIEVCILQILILISLSIPHQAWNVKVDEMTTWDWQNKKDAQSNVGFDNHEDFQTFESVDDFPVRDTRSLEDIYQRCSLAITEPTVM